MKTEDGAVVFGQIYGMAEQISVPLAMAGFTVYKSVPYGPLTEVSSFSWLSMRDVDFQTSSLFSNAI